MKNKVSRPAISHSFKYKRAAAMFFRQDGKPLGKPQQTAAQQIKPISTIIDSQNPQSAQLHKKTKSSVAKTLTISATARSLIAQIQAHLQMRIQTKYLLAGTAFASIIIATVSLSHLSYAKNSYLPTYSIYSAKPLVLGSMSSRIYGEDSRAEVLDKILAKYSCPMIGYGDVFVEEADKNNIPYWLVAAISFQESGCGKKTPKAENGEESYNAWGWAVWGDNVHKFQGWEGGIKTVSQYMSNKFWSKGITDLCDVMKIYTPPSKGSWCKGVAYFQNVIENYKTN